MKYSEPEKNVKFAVGNAFLYTQKMERKELKKSKLPDMPGVYLFKKGRKILYIGKAASLSDRVRSYFSPDLEAGRGNRIVGMVRDASSLSWQGTDSVLEALILEAHLIKRHQPPYNVDQKDNKSWNYVVITKEAFPRVLLVRGRELFQSWKESDIKHLFGPFPHGGQLKEALKIVRRIFPFRDTCTPASGKSCFNHQIGLCPGVCSGETSKEEYGRTVRNIRQLFSGNFKGLKRQLARDMKAAVSSERFEDAARLRGQISALGHIRDVSLIKGESRVSPGGGIRIEAFDIAHTSGTETVAVMTVVQNGEVIKAAYRKFKIHSATNDDVAALKEVLSRRLTHAEWPLPRVFVIDGGKAQMRAAERVLKESGVAIPIVGVVKDRSHKPERLIGDTRAVKAYEKDILLANNEAHRFAINWHRKRLRQKNLSA